jgi:integrase/recombinase XerD
VRRIFDACSSRSLTGIRNRALITVLYRCGLRVSELVALLPADVTHEGSIRVRNNRRSRVCALDPPSYGILDDWIERRKERRFAEDAPLFCTLRGGSLKPSYLRALMTRLGRKAGIKKRVSAEVLRRTLAAELATEGAPISLIQAHLGHSSTATTERFLARAKPAGLVPAMRARPNWLD